MTGGKGEYFSDVKRKADAWDGSDPIRHLDKAR